MKLDIMKKWVRALRSGKFRQFRGGGLRSYDRRTVGYCCLGVLCELHRTSTKTQCEWHGGGYGVAGEHRSSFPVGAVLRWAGLRDENPQLSNNAACGGSAASLNDGGWSFKEIADAIEARQKAGKLT